MDIKTVEEFDVLYYKVFYGDSNKETFTHKKIEYVIKHEYSKRYPKIYYGDGVCDSHKFADMRKVIKGEPVNPGNLPKPHPYMYR